MEIHTICVVYLAIFLDCIDEHSLWGNFLLSSNDYIFNVSLYVCFTSTQRLVVITGDQV